MPRFLQNYFAPTNRHWQGSHKIFLPLVLVKILLLLVIIPLCIAEISLRRKWISGDSYYDNDDDEYNYWWVRWGIVVFLETAHIIVQLVCIATNNNHPIFALVGSICGFGLWLPFAVLNAILAYGSEIFFTNNDIWVNICYGESALMALMTVLYTAMLVFSSMAVHRYRKSKPCSCKRNGQEGRLIRRASILSRL